MLQAELAAAQADGEKVVGLQQQLMQFQEQTAQLRTKLAAAEQEALAESADLRRQLQQVCGVVAPCAHPLCLISGCSRVA